LSLEGVESSDNGTIINFTSYHSSEDAFVSAMSEKSSSSDDNNNNNNSNFSSSNSKSNESDEFTISDEQSDCSYND
jgi:hypothetical protein